jgi:hypothetical protein
MIIDRLLCLKGERHATIRRVVGDIGVERDVGADPDTQIACPAYDEIVA